MQDAHGRVSTTELGALTRLKRDAFGSILLDPDARVIVRDTDTATAGIRWLARRLARREARALARLSGSVACPRFVAATRTRLERSWLDGEPMYNASFDPKAYFRDALRQLRRMHACGVIHNDLAKEANWICMDGNRAGIVDFQVALCFSQRGPMLRLLGREDLRHLLKHKRHYAPQLLSRRQREILARPAWTALLWRRVYKPLYRFVTRRLLGWNERDSAIERSV